MNAMYYGLKCDETTLRMCSVSFSSKINYLKLKLG